MSDCSCSHKPINELALAQNCELNTLRRVSFLPLLLRIFHMLSCSLFPLILPCSAVFSCCHFLISLHSLIVTFLLHIVGFYITLSLSVLQSRSPHKIVDYIYLLLSRLTGAVSYWLPALCPQTRLLFLAGRCWFLGRHQVTQIYCQVVQPLCLGYCTQATVSRKQVYDPSTLTVRAL